MYVFNICFVFLVDFIFYSLTYCLIFDPHNICVLVRVAQNHPKNTLYQVTYCARLLLLITRPAAAHIYFLPRHAFISLPKITPKHIQHPTERFIITRAAAFLTIQFGKCGCN